MADLIKTLSGRADEGSAMGASPALGFVEGFVPMSLSLDMEKKKTESERTTDILKEREKRSVILSKSGSDIMNSFLKSINPNTPDLQPGVMDKNELSGVLRTGQMATSAKVAGIGADAKFRAASLMADTQEKLKQYSNTKQAEDDLNRSIDTLTKTFKTLDQTGMNQDQADKLAKQINFLTDVRSKLYGYRDNAFSWEQIQRQLNLDMYSMIEGSYGSGILSNDNAGGSGNTNTPSIEDFFPE